MSDLIDECGKDLSGYGYLSQKLGRFGATSNKLVVESSGKAKELGFGKGHYFVINTPLLSNFLEEHKKMVEDAVFSHLQFLFGKCKIGRRGKILFVGIGNPNIEADAFGNFVVEKIEIGAYDKNNRIIKICPNTFSNTGINAFDITKILVEAYDISVVVLFDSLLTNVLARLGCSIQINDAGLTPGSAMNNFGKQISKDTLGVPCISIGVPMMISSLSFDQKQEVILTEKDALQKLGFWSDVVSSVFNKMLKT